MDNSSLAHTKWNCKYHIVFAPKYRRQMICGKIKTDIGIILRKLCERKGVEIIESKILSAPLKYSLMDEYETSAKSIFKKLTKKEKKV